MEIRERILGYVIMNGKLWERKKYRANLKDREDIEKHRQHLMSLHGLDKKNKAIERHNKKYPHDKKELFKIEFRTRLVGSKPVEPEKKRIEPKQTFQFRSFEDVKIMFAQ